MELYVLRHGTTEWNKLRRLQGRTEIPLDQEGRELAIKTGEGLRDIHFDLCFTSPLKRARETAELVLAGKNVPIIEDQRLIEMNFGKYEGMYVSPKGVDNNPVTKTLEMDLHGYITPPGGETMEELCGRTKDFFDEITRNPEYEDMRILVSMHGASSRALMLNAWGRESFWHGGVPKNCTISIVYLKHGEVLRVEQDVVFAGKR